MDSFLVWILGSAPENDTILIRAMPVKPRPTILDIAPYVPGKHKAGPGVTTRFKLSSNESPFGASPHAVKAVQESGDDLALYPDGASTALREVIGEEISLFMFRRA